MLSRVADSLYWMSRYLERAEHTARLLEVQLNTMLDDPSQTTLDRWRRVLLTLNHPLPGERTDDYGMMFLLAFDSHNEQSIIYTIGAARENARQIREMISSEMWMQINSLYLFVKGSNLDRIWNNQPSEFLRAVREGAHLFQGITDGTMVRNEGWHFIRLGRAIERAIAIIDLIDVQFSNLPQEPTTALSLEAYSEWLSFLKYLTAFEAYCKVYDADLRVDRIARFLLYHPLFPHALRFNIEEANSAIEAIAEETGHGRQTRLMRSMGRLRSSLSYDDVDEVMPDIHNYLSQLKRQCSQIHTDIYEEYIYRRIDSALS